MVFRKYTEAEKEFIRSFAFGHSHQEITDAFNERFDPPIGANQIRAYLKNHKILTGRTGFFEKGHVPANKGTHTGGWEPTQFKKGNTPANHKPVGTESVRCNYKKGQKYLYVKVAEPNRWRMKHILVWEKHHGPVPKGKIIIFLDGNVLNTDIDNLMMIDRSVHARMNQLGLRSRDPEITRTGAYVAELVTKVSEVKKR
ncbi:HNH endonuclease signature motif containing protein [Lacrimispora sp.]|uniref:HNH endonuclease signature motif containing protein n=1 Tax=Lacrimispora sp. TaxID=2719234 RepID=UPI00289868E7|nr:HNH endonuclease signature motif containing protein [Lacrimispora sp.]